ncbi:MAG: peptidoglycan D,D-transpeptidase FtsI family protein, partial [Acidiferrobacterales bacterium]
LAYRELKAAVKKHNAKSASAIVLDAESGEILAMVNEPGFNPNSRLERQSQLFRNRAVTDVLEPGSTLKPFTIAAALESGRYTPGTWVNTSPGFYKIGSKTIRDSHNYGRLTVAGVIQKSSNVGAAKIALTIGKQRLWEILNSVGFGQRTGSALPGEATGTLRDPDNWVTLDQAVMSYGYGISVTPIQLARAYTALANEGNLVQLTMLPGQEPVYTENVMSRATAKQILKMLELAAGSQGTGNAAQVRFYRVAGKTGTVHKLVNGKYSDDDYVALFAGVAPVSNPRLVMVVTVDNPSGDQYYGGQIAAPVFANVIAGAMRLLNIPPDAGSKYKKQIVKVKKSGPA